MSRDKRSDDPQIRVGNIQNSTGIVIGNESSAVVSQHRPPVQEEVSVLLDEFIRSFELYVDSLDDAQSVRQAAVTARAEIARPTPKWQTVRGMLKTMAAGVVGVATLTDAINNIQVLVAHVVD